MIDDLVIRGERVLLDGDLRPATLHIANGRIRAVDAKVQGPVIDAGKLLVTPGIVDTHVHLNEPGRTEWEGFRTATEAAAAGGITTVVDMPLNCIPATTTRDAVLKKREALEGKLHVDVAFWGGVVPGNAGDLEGMAREGVPGAKCFTCPSGVDEFPHVVRADLERAMPILRDLGLTLLVHAEAPGPLEEAEARVAGQDPRAYATYLRSRPTRAEDDAIAMVIDLARRHRCPSHIVHLSAATAIPMIARAQQEGVPITAETCLHYLTFTAEEVPPGQTQYKCAPPIRERANREALWQGLGAGAVGMIVSDHSPCTPQLKKPEQGDFLGAWGGIAGLQLGLSALWTQCKARGVSLATMFAWNAGATARLAGLARKGRLAVGHDADVVLWDDAASFTVEPSMIRHRHKVTPYAGRTLAGVVERTFLRGREAYSRAGGLAKPGGAYVTKG
jgi:allantoinase